MEPIFQYDSIENSEYLEFYMFCASVLDDERVLKSVFELITNLEQLHKKDDKKDADS